MEFHFKSWGVDFERIAFLHVGNCVIRNLTGLLDDFVKLERLDLSENDFVGLESSPFKGLSSLRNLILRDSKVDVFDERSFVGLGNLTVLSFGLVSNSTVISASLLNAILAEEGGGVWGRLKEGGNFCSNLVGELRDGVTCKNKASVGQHWRL